MIHPLLPRGKEVGLPVVSGILLTLSFPPFHLLIPPFVALVPYLAFVAERSPDANGAASVRRATFWMGVVFYGTLLYWLFAALVFYTWLALLGYLITVVVLSGFLTAAGWAVHHFRFRHAMPFWLSVPLFWTAAEWIPGHLGDLAFPWLGLGQTLTGYPALIGFADLTGTRGVGLWLAAINGLLAEWWLADSRRRWGRWALALTLLAALPPGYSLFRWFSLEMRPAAEVLVVQPNIREDLRLEPAAATDSSRIALGRLTRQGLEEHPDVELIVWPEAALPTYPQYAPDWVPWARSIAAESDIALLFGLPELERHPNGDYDYYNAALFVDSRGGARDLYRKHYLVPIVERVPYLPVRWIRSLRRQARDIRVPVLGELSEFLRWFGGFGRGEEEPIHYIDGSGFGVLICYESIFANLARTYRRAGADFLVNITNDAWFGREQPWWSRTSALYQHPAHLVMRAVENRVGVARAANTGISMFVDPFGRIYEATRLFEPAVRAATVQTSDGLTLYARLGDWPGTLCAGSAVLLVALSWWRRRRRHLKARALA